MFRTALLGAVGLAAAAGGPFAFYSAKDQWKSFGERSSSATAAAAAESNPADETSRRTPIATAAVPGNLPIEGMPTSWLGEVFNFDVTIGWVTKCWPRVSTGMADMKTHGYRVPLMTGTRLSDLAGSLTYYFDTNQTVERITFTGTTGDARELVALVTRRYGFTRRLTNDPGLFVYEATHSRHARNSILELRLARVVKSSNPYQRFKVTLSIERPAERKKG